jgi:hypothetical protein
LALGDVGSAMSMARGTHRLKCSENPGAGKRRCWRHLWGDHLRLRQCIVLLPREKYLRHAWLRTSVVCRCRNDLPVAKWQVRDHQSQTEFN